MNNEKSATDAPATSTSEQPAINVVKLTPELLDNIAAKLNERQADINERFPQLVNECPYETKLAVTAWVFDNIVKHAAEGGTFRRLIYTRLGFHSDAYFPLYAAGGMIISNEFDLAKATNDCTYDEMETCLRNRAMTLASDNPSLTSRAMMFRPKISGKYQCPDCYMSTLEDIAMRYVEPTDEDIKALKLNQDDNRDIDKLRCNKLSNGNRYTHEYIIKTDAGGYSMLSPK
jgi:hypothetical protein